MSDKDITATEGFQPRAHLAPTTPWRRLLFVLRLTADLQFCSVYRDIARPLRRFRGRMLDIGCGNSPFRHLLVPVGTTYQGIDVQIADSFGYHNPDVTPFDGRTIPFPDATFDALLCTEVLEHVAEPAPLIAEMHRVLKPGGFGLITIPWSARFHYQPHDYHRYTPSMIRILFSNFSRSQITPRGTDLSSISSKIVVCYLRNLKNLTCLSFPAALLAPLRLLAAILFAPFAAVVLSLGQSGIWFGVGSDDDPLGYTVMLWK